MNWDWEKLRKKQEKDQQEKTKIDLHDYLNKLVADNLIGKTIEIRPWGTRKKILATAKILSAEIIRQEYPVVRITIDHKRSIIDLILNKKNCKNGVWDLHPTKKIEIVKLEIF